MNDKTLTSGEGAQAARGHAESREKMASESAPGLCGAAATPGPLIPLFDKSKRFDWLKSQRQRLELSRRKSH